MIKQLTCIMCPVSCNLQITKKNNEILVTGNACIRGETYAKQELTNPKRTVTTLVKTNKGVLPCKTTKEIDKDKIFDCLAEINKINLKSAKPGDIIIKNVLNSDADVVITGNYQK